MIFPTAYLAPIGYYQALGADTSPEIEQWESFPKQTFRNRCQILGANGVQLLSIPVCHVERKQYTKDVRISYQGKWQHQHWIALKSAYKNSPFFEYYEDEFAHFYETKYNFLLDFNQALHEQICQFLHISPNALLTSNYQAGDIDHVFYNVNITPYYQVFTEQNFIENLSIVDLLFNMGNESILYLR